MFSIIHVLFGIVHIILAIWAFRIYQRKQIWGLLIIALIALGLSYDNFVVGAGRFVGIGSTLESLSILRIPIHVFLTPLLLISALAIAKEASLAWADKLNVMLVTVGIAIALIFVGVVQDDIFNLSLQPACHSDTIRYVDAVHERQVCEGFDYSEEIGISGIPPIASVLTILGVIAIGAAIWRSTKVRWMLIGAVIMFITAAIPASIVGLWVGNSGEVILIACMCLTASVFIPPKMD